MVGLGIRPGDRVAFRSPNRAEPLIAALAAWRLGAVVVPTPPQAREAELRFYLEDTRARILFSSAQEGMAEPVLEAVTGTAVERVIALGPGLGSGFDSWDRLLAAASPRFDGPPPPVDSPAVIWHTGGTTGTPKASYHTQHRFLLGGYAAGLATGVRAGERWAAAAPIGHALGFLLYTTFTLLHGATAVLIDGYHDPQVVLEAIGRHRVDTFTAIAATWSRMREAAPGASVTSLRRAYAMWQSASSAIPASGGRHAVWS